MAKNFYNLSDPSWTSDINGVRVGTVKVRSTRTVDESLPDATVAVDPDGSETVVTGTLEAAAAVAMSAYLSLTLVEADMEIV